ncbi:MAG: TIGR01212 family radical SAM protein [Erysipelotrichales bacterium]|nr:TIGR01212 family radical SAM protein [Erysipelotrichales bacterium]
MTNKFKYSNTNKRYYTYDFYLKNKFGCKVFKVPLDAGFTCPNRDGTVGTGGCIFCNAQGSGEFSGNRLDGLEKQFHKMKTALHQKWPVAKYIAYFQAFTNTYAPVEILKNKFESFINMKNVVGISIATRPDCLPINVLNYLEELSKKTELWVELGLQTINNKTAKLINRGYDYNVFLNAVKELRKRNINITVHIINGLPYETKKDMIDTIKSLSKLDIQGIKIHSLNILKNTELARLYLSTNFYIMSFEEYIDLLVEQLEYLRENIVVQRISGDAISNELIEPKWSINKRNIANSLDKKMSMLDTYQGIKYHE